MPVARNANMGNERIRVPGHGYSLFLMRGTPIAVLTNMQHTSPQPLGQAVDVQPLNFVRPWRVVTGRAITSGELTATVVEVFNHRIWDHFNFGFGQEGVFHDLADVLHHVARSTTIDPNHFRVTKVVRMPRSGVILEQYKNVVITDIREDENTETGTMTNNLSMTMKYTHKKITPNEGPDAQGADPFNIPEPRIY